MLFSKSHVCFQFCFCFIVLLSALPPVRADYFSAYNRVYKAFRRFTLPIPRSALPDDQVLSTHEYYLDGNITLIEEAETKYYNGELSYEEAQNEARPAYDDSLFTFYEIIGDYMGVGIHASCKENISEVLREANEWDKAGAQAASVIMALLPSLLTFGNLYVPRSSEAFGTSFLVGFMSAVFGFGLPVRSISAVPVKHTITLARLSWKALNNIGKLGELKEKRVVPAKLSDLQTWSDDPDCQMSTDDRCFAQLSDAALRWGDRKHWWHLPSLLIAASQVLILMFCVFPLFMGFGVPTLLFDCSYSVTSIYLLISAVVSSVVRFLMWETSSHERVHVFALSESAEKQLRWIANRTPQELSTEVCLPPLQAPLLIRPAESAKRNIKRFWSGATRMKRQMTQRQKTRKPTQAYAAINNDSYWMIPVQFVKVVFARLQWIVTNLVTFFLAGFQDRNAAIRWRPLIVLIHLSTTGRDPLKTLFTGVVEGAVLLVLTFFFSAQWAGNLVVTMYSVSYLLVAVSVARALGLIYIKWSVRSAGLHVIECESVEEIYGSLRVICSMKRLLVRVNGAWYFEGKRLDNNPEYWEWELQSERGEFDEKPFKFRNSSSTSSTPPVPAKTFSGQVTFLNHSFTV